MKCAPLTDKTHTLNRVQNRKKKDAIAGKRFGTKTVDSSDTNCNKSGDGNCTVPPAKRKSTESKTGDEALHPYA